MTSVENDLKIDSEDVIFANISERSLKTAAEIFIYLYPMTGNCPFNTFHSWFSIWSPFYTDLFSIQSADKIILNINRVIKTASQPSRDAAEDIFMRTATLLSLKYKYIQSMLPQKSRKLALKENFLILKNSKGMLDYII